MIFLAVAGVSLCATAVQWWNRGRVEEVEADLRRLVNERDQLLAQARDERGHLVARYLRELDAVADREFATLAEVRSELRRAEDQARAAFVHPFGGVERGMLQRMLLELEQASARLEAEEAYLSGLRTKLSVARTRKGELEEIPSPAIFDIPADFPREGGLVQVASSGLLHGYQVDVDETATNGAVLALYKVDHERHRARACPVRGGLLAALLQDGRRPIEATVEQVTADGVQLDHRGTKLLLEQPPRRNYPGDKLEVYLGPTSMRDVLAAPERRRSTDWLKVTTLPPVSGTRDRWTPLLVRVEEDQLPAVTRAYEKIHSNNLVSSASWRISIVEDGQGQLEFAMAGIGLRVDIALETGCFILRAIADASRRPRVAVRLQADLHVFLSGSDDAVRRDGGLLAEFVEAVHRELASQKLTLVEREAALELRKLSMIYQDQAEAAERTNSLGLFVTSAWFERGAFFADALLLTSVRPNWLVDATSNASAAARLQITARGRELQVRSIEALDVMAGLYRIAITDADRGLDRALLRATRLSCTTEAFQQRRLVRAIEDTILGGFVSMSVRRTLLTASPCTVDDAERSPTDLLAAITSMQDVFAIWGPPGTGKTTFLVDLIRQQIERDANASMLICAPTHVAVDELVSRLIRAQPELEERIVRYMPDDRELRASLRRVGHRAGLAALRERLDADSEHEELDGRAGWRRVLSSREGRASAQRWLLEDKSIHAATCVGMARGEFGLGRHSFDLVVIDEAGKAFAAELLLPASRARRLIVVGDHNQLPPTVTDEALSEEIGYRLDPLEVEQLLRTSFFGTLFERLPIEKKGMLSTQYRMHPEIGRVVSKLFYGGKLHSARDGGSRAPTRARVTLLDLGRVREYRGIKGPQGRSQRNQFERRVCLELLRGLTGRSTGRELETLVVCPYEAQRAEVAVSVAEELPRSNIRVTTVDAVQGGEADVVVLLMTRTRGNAEFVLDRHRLNVALSRAREAVVVIGAMEFLSAGERGPVGRLLELCERGEVRRVVAPTRGRIEQLVNAVLL